MFQDEAFLEDGFSAESFVNEHRKNLTLEKLRSELEDYVAHLDNSLVNIINNDYSAFLKLSSMLVDIDALVAGLREPLNQLEGKVEDVRSVVSAPLGKQVELMENLLYVQEKKKVIKLCLSARETLEKVENQVNQLRKASLNEERKENSSGKSTTSEKESPEDESSARPTGTLSFSESTGEALGRATQRLARVSFLSQENQGLPLLRSIKAKARSLEHALLEELDKAFVLALQMQAEPDAQNRAIVVVLRAYVAINKRDQANAVFMTKVVKPFLQDLFTQGNIDAGGSRGSANGLKTVYQKVIEFVQTKCTPLLNAVGDAREGLGQIDFVGTSVSQGLYETIKEHMAFVYTSGSADTLHSSYLKTSALFKVLSYLSPGSAGIESTRCKTMDLWNLSVYTQLRSQEMFRILDESLEQPICNSSESNDGGFTLEASKVLIKCIQECWEEKDGKVFLDRVGAQIFRLTMELLSRFTVWAAQGVLLVSQSQQIEAPATLKEYVEDSGTDQVASLAEKAWGDSNAACEDLLLVVADCSDIKDTLQNLEYKIQMKLFLPNVNSAEVESGRKAVHRALTDICGNILQDISSGAQSAVLFHLVKDCQDSLVNGLKNVAPMYRMTNRPAPTEASSFVSKVLEPLRVFSLDRRAKLLSKDLSETLSRSVCLAVIEAFESTSKKILDEVVSSENALRRLKRNASNKQMDSDKIRIQFNLDLENISVQCTEMGVELEDIELYRSLKEQFSNLSV